MPIFDPLFLCVQKARFNQRKTWFLCAQNPNHDNPQVDVDADYCVVIESEKSAISEDELTTKVIEPFKQASENLVGVRLSSSQRDPDGRYLLGFNIEKDVDPSKAYEVIDQFLTKFASSKPDGVEIMLISYSH